MEKIKKRKDPNKRWDLFAESERRSETEEKRKDEYVEVGFYGFGG